MTQSEMFFEPRFLDKHAGTIISDPSVAIVELVANAWDAYATKVEIFLGHDEESSFSIKDNGYGMAKTLFERIWRTIDYDRISHLGGEVTPQPQSGLTKKRHVFGRNGRGRFAGFCFGEYYKVTSKHNGEMFSCKVLRGVKTPIELEWLSEGETEDGNGTFIECIQPHGIRITEDQAREVLSSRFISDPDFHVFVNGKLVEFKDIPSEFISIRKIEFTGLGIATLIHIDIKKADKTIRQHGIAWWIKNRLVGKCEWRVSDYEKILDGRTGEAKRNTFIVKADFLESAVLPDWEGFDSRNEIWQAVQAEIQKHVLEMIDATLSQKRDQTKQAAVAKNAHLVSRMALLSRQRWDQFVDEVIENCPRLSEADIVHLSTILATLEMANSRYGILEKLHKLRANELDDLHNILNNWTLKMAKIVLDEVEERLRLIKELSEKVNDPSTDEVQELQPLFENGLWIFGPEFETIEFTSNKGMTTVLRDLFGDETKGTLNRPDFVILPDSTLGAYSRPPFGDDYNVVGVDHVVLVELKRPRIPIGREQKNQVWKYIRELMARGHITETTKVTAFILGSDLDPYEGKSNHEGNVHLRPMIYDVVVKQAEMRLMNLYCEVKGAPFLEDKDDALGAFLKPIQPPQEEMRL